MRRALILALGAYQVDGEAPSECEPLVGKLLDLYKSDPDAGIHGAAEWTLRQWKNERKLKEIDDELSKLKDWGQRRWFVNGLGQTFAVIDGPVEFIIGSPRTEPDRFEREIPHRVLIPRRFAIATKEASKAHWQAFVKQNPQPRITDNVDRYSRDQAGAMAGFSWFIAAQFCNWLSEQDGLPKEEWCYVPTENEKYAIGMTIPGDVLGAQRLSHAHRGGMGIHLSVGNDHESLLRFLSRFVRRVCSLPVQQRGPRLDLREPPTE